MSDATMRFSAADAIRCGLQRDRRRRALYNVVLHRCLRQIHTVASKGDGTSSLIFTIPAQVGTELVPFAMPDLITYLVSALRDDRDFIVCPTQNSNKLYVGWQSLQSAAREAAAAADLRSGIDPDRMYPHTLPNVPDLDKDIGMYTRVEATPDTKPIRSARKLAADVDELLRNI